MTVRAAYRTWANRLFSARTVEQLTATEDTGNAWTFISNFPISSFLKNLTL